jgi:hypothetical protein
MKIIDDLLAALPDGTVRTVVVGAFWTAVVVESGGHRRCGLASTLRSRDDHNGGGPAVPDAGRLAERRARELAELSRSPRPLEVSIGMATVNALMPRQEELWVERNAEEVIVAHGAGRNVTLVGHFPFVPRVRAQLGNLWVLELQPQADDLPASAAAAVIPQSHVLAVTGTTLMNRTFAGLMALRRPDAVVLMLGPSTPLSPILFDYGVHLLSGAVVEDIDAVLRAVSQGADFRQVHRQGVRLVTLQDAKDSQ